MPKDFDQQSDQGRREFWEGHLEQWEQSGLSQLAYCRQHHLKSHRFYYWRRRILKKQTNVSFLPIRLSANPMPHPQTVRVLMPNGCSIEIEGLDGSEQLTRLVNLVVGL